VVVAAQVKAAVVAADKVWGKVEDEVWGVVEGVAWVPLANVSVPTVVRRFPIGKVCLVLRLSAPSVASR